MSDSLNPKRGLIAISARLAKCHILAELAEFAENQKTINSENLSLLLERAASELRDEAAYVRNMANKIDK